MHCARGQQVRAIMSERWVRRPEGSNWGDFGPDDQRGRLNLLTPAKVLQGVAEVREGRSFCLSLPLDRPGRGLNPARHPPRRFATVRHEGRPTHNFLMSTMIPEATDVINDDAVLIHTQVSTQWDSLAHVGCMFDVMDDGEPVPVFYNGWRGDLHIVAPRENPDAHEWLRFEGMEAKALGIQNMAETGVQGRGVLIDLHALFGREGRLAGYDDIMRACEASGATVEPGDMVCLYTGFDEVVLEMGADTDVKALHASCARLDGRDEKLLQWITDSGLAVLIADNYAVEQVPGTSCDGACAALPLHQHCLFKLGIHLGELWRLGELAAWLKANNRTRFLLTAPPLRLPGAVGSPTTPVATV
jgi:kynurenine formamidase